MGVRKIVSERGTTTALYDSTSGWAFGPLFDTEEDADAFLEFLPLDARTYTDDDLKVLYSRWVESREVAV